MVALWPLILGFAGSLAIGLLAFRRGSLSGSGVLGALLTGTLCFGFGGWALGGALVLFFVTASALSRAFPRAKANLEADYAKGSRRDIWQALANGGVAAVLCAGGVLLGQPWLMLGALGALATACADTWATEVGPALGGQPYLVTSGRRVPAGTSGGISWPGTLAGALGALLLGAWAAYGPRGLGVTALWVAPLAGVLGSLADSLLGATLQARYHCPHCDRATEQTRHHCGHATVRIGGVQGFGNDLVNFLATAVGAIIALALA